MQSQLIDAEPRHAYQLRDGWRFQFGEMVLGQRFGMVYLTQPQPRYIIFKVMLGETGLPEVVFEKERDLTPEEIAHFTKLAKEEERKTKREQHQERRRELMQQQQNAIAEATGGRVLQ